MDQREIELRNRIVNLAHSSIGKRTNLPKKVRQWVRNHGARLDSFCINDDGTVEIILGFTPQNWLSERDQSIVSTR